MKIPDKCPKCGCDLVTEVYSINRQRVALLCGGCLATRAIAVKPKARSCEGEAV
jgi:hypothetical protein